MSDLPIFDRNRRYPAPEPEELGDGTIITLADYTGQAEPRVDPATGSISIDTEDGGVMVQLDPAPVLNEEEDDSFFANLAGRIDPAERGRIVDEVMQGIESDIQSRQEWLENRAEGIKMLGSMLEKPQTGDMGTASGPVEGMSTVRHPLLMEAVCRFQATAAGELYPPSGPVKIRDDRPARPAGLLVEQPGLGHNGGPPLDADGLAAEAASREARAEALERGFNYNLTVVDRGYRPDSVRMLFWVGFGGCGFKKVYDCPIRGRPISRFVDAEDLIVSNAVSDHRDAERVTHRIRLRRAMVRRMQVAGVYRDVELHEPTFTPDAVEQAKAAAQGIEVRPQRQEDTPRTMFETYAELDVRGLEHTRNGRPTHIPLPYKLTIDETSRELLELRRNWDPDDDTFTARQVFVKYGFIPAMGFYDFGLLHLLGNGDKALTAAWREVLDCGMFGNFPGFIYNEGIIRNWTNNNRVPPGGGIGIKGVGNLPLDQVIKPLPYKDVGAGMVAVISAVEQRMDRVAGTADIPVGEGRQDAPVGTTLALIEQATKILAAAHIGLHASQSEEFQLLKERYRGNPEAFWRWNKKAQPWEKEEFLRALDDCELVPAADPNTPSHMIRLIRAQAVKMVAMQNKELYDMKAVDRWIYEMIGVSNPDMFFAPPPDPNQPPPMDPLLQATLATIAQKREQAAAEGQIKLATLEQKQQADAAEHQATLVEMAIEAEAKARDIAAKGQQKALESADRAADRASEERRAGLSLEADLVKQHQEHAHQTRQGLAERLAPTPPGEGP